MKISVVICTHNRANSLRETMQSVLEQDTFYKNYELIVIDNVSVDQTRQVVEEFAVRYPNVRYIFEPKLGLSHARNRGWQEARGEYVAYLDDDALAVPGWLAAANEVISSVHPAIFGGATLPLYRTPKPAWYKDEYSTDIRLSTPGVLKSGFISGCNNFNRKDILERLGGFGAEFGMVGEKSWYGEETELQMRLKDAYPQEIIYYHPAVAIRHLVTPRKMRIFSVIDRRFNNGRVLARAWKKNGHEEKLVNVLMNSLLCIVGIVKGVIKTPFRNKVKYPFWQNFVYEQVSPIFSRLGTWMEYTMLSRNGRRRVK